MHQHASMFWHLTHKQHKIMYTHRTAQHQHHTARDQDQISRTMGLFSMTNLRHMLVHRSASFLGRTRSSPPLLSLTHTHALSLSTETSPRAYTCSVPCINGSCARMTNSWPVIQMPRFRIIARHAPQKQHPSRTLTKQTNHSLQAKGKWERDTETRAGRSKELSRSRLRRHNIER